MNPKHFLYHLWPEMTLESADGRKHSLFLNLVTESCYTWLKEWEIISHHQCSICPFLDSFICPVTLHPTSCSSQSTSTTSTTRSPVQPAHPHLSQKTITLSIPLLSIQFTCQRLFAWFLADLSYLLGFSVFLHQSLTLLPPSLLLLLTFLLLFNTALAERVLKVFDLTSFRIVNLPLVNL